MSTQLSTVYLNGHLLPLSEAHISPLDRGFLFGEGVYEVIPVYGGRALNYAAHVDRLQHSLSMIGLVSPISDKELEQMLHNLIDVNGGGDLAVYIQITRGVSDSVRNHVFPDAFTPTIFAMCQSLEPRPAAIASEGVKAITLDDERWAHCDIKATSLLANTLARQHAKAAGASEAILIRDDLVTEGAASTVIIVDGERVVQPPPAAAILPGTTAPFVHSLLKKSGVTITFEPISVTRLRNANEIWLASSTREVLPVTRLDDKVIGAGKPGPRWQALDALYQRAKRATDHP